MDATGETMGIGHIDVHVAGRKGTVDGFRTIELGNIDIAESHSHHIGAEDTSLKDTDANTKGVDGGTSRKDTASAIQHRIGIGHFDIVDESETSDVVEHSIEATDIGDVDTTPTGATGPGIDKQFGGTRGSTTFIVASLG